MAELLQRIHHARHRPAGEGAALARAPRRAAGASQRGAVDARRRPARVPPAAAPPAAASSTAASCTPCSASHAQRLRRRAAAQSASAGSGCAPWAAGWAASVRAQQQPRLAGRLLQRLQQRAGGLQVHALRPGASRTTLAAAARRGLHDPVDGGAHLVDPDLRGWASSCSCRPRRRRRRPPCPSRAHAQRLGQQHMQVGMRARLQQTATAASAAGPGRRRRASHSQACASVSMNSSAPTPSAPAPAAHARAAARSAWRSGASSQGKRQAAVAAYHHGRCSSACSNLRPHRVAVGGGVDAHEALRRLRHALRVALAHALEEGLVLLLEAVAARAPPRGVAAASAGGRSNHSVRSGWRPCCTQAPAAPARRRRSRARRPGRQRWRR